MFIKANARFLHLYILEIQPHIFYPMLSRFLYKLINSFNVIVVELLLSTIFLERSHLFLPEIKLQFTNYFCDHFRITYLKASENIGYIVSFYEQ